MIDSTIKESDDELFYPYLAVGLEAKVNEDFLMHILQDIANSPWMQQRAKDGKQVILAGKA